MKRPTAFTVIAVALLTVAGLAACNRATGTTGARDERKTAATGVGSFHALYDQHCAGCHGRDGRLGAARPLNDALYLSLVPASRVRDVIAAGVPGTSQPAFGVSAGGPLTDSQIDALVQGLRETWGHSDPVRDASLPPYASVSGDPERGSVIFVAACAGCHGTDGRGGPKARSVVDASYLALVSEQHLRTTVIAGRVDLGMPDWREQLAGRALIPQEISDVVAWLVVQRRQVPGRPVVRADAPHSSD